MAPGVVVVVGVVHPDVAESSRQVEQVVRGEDYFRGGTIND